MYATFGGFLLAAILEFASISIHFFIARNIALYFSKMKISEVLAITLLADHN
jgi:hypothetical protein